MLAKTNFAHKMACCVRTLVPLTKYDTLGVYCFLHFNLFIYLFIYLFINPHHQ